MAAYPILFIFAANIDKTLLIQLWSPLALSIGIGLLSLLLLGFAFNDMNAAVLVVSAGLLLFFSYGHLFQWLNDLPDTTLRRMVVRHAYLLPLWAILFGVSVYIAIWRRKLARQLVRFFLVFVTVLTSFVLFNIVSYLVTNNVRHEARASNDDLTLSHTPYGDIDNYEIAVEQLPHVYYIILDGYGRADILDRNFGYDNEEFVRALEDRGFFVAQDSNSNYLHTQHSLVSSLNMSYLTELGNPEGFQELKELVWENSAAQFLKAIGYEYYLFPSGIAYARKSPLADHQFKVEFSQSEFMYILMRSSVLRVADDFIFDFNQPNIFSASLAQTSVVARYRQPTFAFLHILSPHPPYLFTTSALAIDEDTLEAPNQWVDRQAYAREVDALNEVILSTIDGILKNSHTTPIIIIQGDHGPASAMFEYQDSIGDTADYTEVPNYVVEERAGILNAYYGPDDFLAQLYPSISPVNSFRVVFNYLLEPDLELEPDITNLDTKVNGVTVYEPWSGE